MYIQFKNCSVNTENDTVNNICEINQSRFSPPIHKLFINDT